MGGGMVEGDCKREESQPALERKWAERGFCLSKEGKQGFHINLETRQLDQTLLYLRNGM